VQNKVPPLLEMVQYIVKLEFFDRINRNVKKLTPQELRHARFNGLFINTAEDLTEWMITVQVD